MKRFLLFISGLIVFSQPALAEPLVFETALAAAWANCNFSQLPHGGKKGHVMLIGDSNGALYGAKGVPLRYFEGDVTTKDWAEFMQPAPAGGWRILNLAVLSDYNVQTGTWNTLPEDPIEEDLGWLLLCFYLRICKL